MRCYYCGGDLDETGFMSIDQRFAEKWCRITKLNCGNCGTYVEVWLPKSKEFFIELEE